mgnify:CR=1 FL=1
MATKLPIRIVVAEDEELIRNHLVKKIEAAGPDLAVVRAAQDGREALDFVRREPVDLVVTDIRMPMMDGLELIKSLHHHFPRIRTIIATGYADFEYARQALRYDVSEYLLKPVKPAELKQALVRVQTSIEHEQQRAAKNLEGAAGRADRPEAIVELVRRYLRENFAKELSLEEISRSFNFTPSYLSKIFMRHTGEPPSKYLISLRIQEAKYLLARHPELTVKEVAERVGYADPFYFSRLFKQMTGVAPTEFQK